MHRFIKSLASPRLGSTSLAVAAGACIALLSATQASALPRPSVPTILEVDPELKLFRVDHAEGTQNYICLPSAMAPSGFAWILAGPQATLFTSKGRQTATHFLSPNPEEGGTARAAWQDSRDTSTVWAVKTQESSDPAFVDPNAIPWFLLEVKGADSGPRGGERISRARYIQRINTSGGKAPATGCEAAGDVGKREFVPYVADYLFFKFPGRPA
jgi:hypothetical protein